MAATLVQGSPYIYISVYRGDLVLRTRDADGEHKGVFHQQGNSEGIWTHVDGKRTQFLLNGHDSLSVDDTHARENRTQRRNRHYSHTWLHTVDAPLNDMVREFERYV